MRNNDDRLEIVFVFNRRHIFGILTKIFTGCYCYHVGFKKGEYFYDMSWMRRSVKWSPNRYPSDRFVMIKCDKNISHDYFIDKIINDNTSYGVADYLSFGFRWLLKPLKIPLKNHNGLICSEQVNKDLIDNGIDTGIEYDAVPSPCELYDALLSKQQEKKHED